MNRAANPFGTLVVEGSRPPSAAASTTFHGVPLIANTRWNSPTARGTDSRTIAAAAPADCPATVTLPGSPPNRAISSRTQASAATQSSTPRLGGASSRTSNPSTPSR